MHSLLVLLKQGSWISSNISTSQSQKHFFFKQKPHLWFCAAVTVVFEQRAMSSIAEFNTTVITHLFNIDDAVFFMLRFYNHRDVIIIVAKGNAIDLNVNTLMTVSVIPPLVLLGIFTLMSGSTPPLKLFMIIIIIIYSSSSSSSTAAATASSSSSNLCHQQTLSRNINIFPLHWCQRQALRLFVIKIILLVIISSWYQHIRISKNDHLYLCHHDRCTIVTWQSHHCCHFHFEPFVPLLLLHPPAVDLQPVQLDQSVKCHN